MSGESEEKPFAIEKAKTGRAACKRCKQKCESGVLRMAKLVPNYFSDSGMMKHWYHVDCLFETFKTQKATSKRIESVDDIDGWDKLDEDERDGILEKITESTGNVIAKPTKAIQPSVKVGSSKEKQSSDGQFKEDSTDNLFATFCMICKKIASESSYKMKSETLQRFLMEGSSKKRFEGDIDLWIKLLLPSANPRIYNLQSKQLVKIFSRVFCTNHQEMLTDLELGDVAETVRKYFEKSKNVKPCDSSSLKMQEVDEFLDKLSQLTKEDDQVEAFAKFCTKASSEELKMTVRLIKHDLRINARARHILDALSPAAYPAFQSSRDLKSVVAKFAPTIGKFQISSSDGPDEGANVKKDGVQVLSPISPMLAEACKSIKKAIAKNPDGMYSEIKYDGERVQIHKRGNEFKFFTRNLKPVMEHKIKRCKDFIPKAFPSGEDMILDSEIIVVNTDTGELMPFGTLGVHKREQFTSSEVCLFIFDCVYYNGEDLTKRPLKERKQILEKNIKPIKHHVQLSEYYLVKTERELAQMTAKVLKAGLEGLVLKSVYGAYQPGKRGWLKIKKDYLFEGQMADTADLVVLGCWYGTGKKGGMLSIFLMGCFDEKRKVWKTVTKVHSGLDDDTMEAVNAKLQVLTERADADHPPQWILCKRPLMPDVIAKDPMQMPVWEITGAEFTKSEAHTADGISIRFPRITKIRDDKSPKEATNLKELHMLYETSKDNVNIDHYFKELGQSNDSNVDIQTKFFDPNKESPKKVKNEPTDDSPESEPKVKREVSTSPSTAAKKRRSEELLSPAEPKKKIKTEVEGKEKSTGPFSATIFIKPSVGSRLGQEAIKTIVKWGGKLTSQALDATIVIHPTSESAERLSTSRTNYQRTSRHLTPNWILDSIKSGKPLPYPDYAVTISD